MLYSFEIMIDFIEYIKEFSYHEHIHPALPLKDKVFAKFYLRQSHITRTYTRRTYDILDYFGDLGGIN